jgi:hypothetical protein
VILIFIALMNRVSRSEKGSGSKKATLYYAGIFVLNGAAGVLSTIYASPLGEGADTSGYYIWSAIFSVIISGVILLTRTDRKNKLPRYTQMAGVVASLRGGINHIANWSLTITLAGGVHASVQYPIVTGGVMIVSTLLCCFGPKKPSHRELLSVLVGFAGMLALFLIPT